MIKSMTVTKHEPQLLEMQAQKMAVVRTVGDPEQLMPLILPALYGTVYALKFDLKKKEQDFKVQPLRARWPDAHIEPKNRWLGIWGLPIPAETSSLRQKSSQIEVDIEIWNYGPVAQILHIGPYSMEEATVERLHHFIRESGYRIAGVHEEEYLTSPDAKIQKTIIRYPVRKVLPVSPEEPSWEESLEAILEPDAREAIPV